MEEEREGTHRSAFGDSEERSGKMMRFSCKHFVLVVNENNKFNACFRVSVLCPQPPTW